MKPNSRLHARPSVRLAAVPLSVAALTGCGAPEATRQPNIVIMMTDDHTCQALSCYDNRLVETPNLDRLAREGMLFENCYVANAISGPSRACILTGKYSHKNGFTDNSRTFDGSQQTFPKLLHDAGYQTAMIGKWHLNSEPQGFDFWSILVAQGEYYSPLFIENGEEKIEPGYVTDVITDKAIGWLEQRDKDRPFAMLYYHKAPHRNWMPAQRHLGIYDDKVFPEPETLLDDYATRGRAAREQEMEIGRHMWPEWDLKLISPEQLRSDLGEAEQESDANKADVKRANDWLSSVKQFQDAYNRMTDEEKTRWDAAYAPAWPNGRRSGARLRPRRSCAGNTSSTCATTAPSSRAWTRTWAVCWTIWRRSANWTTRSSSTPPTRASSWASTAGSTSVSCTRSVSAPRCWSAIPKP